MVPPIGKTPTVVLKSSAVSDVDKYRPILHLADIQSFEILTTQQYGKGR